MSDRTITYAEPTGAVDRLCALLSQPIPIYPIIVRPVQELAPTTKAAPLRVRAKRAVKIKSEEPLTKSELRILERTAIAERFTERMPSFEETVRFTGGRNTTEPAWNRLRKRGYVRECASYPFVALTAKGRKALNSR